ncbi:uncharacterized protein LOC143786019 [Ranitomeya variabilis]|uniref:uncharacterized protein LOC143784583 n=1 Tax=Ranitomeya variabilis TaxID=490064 RepID=UPI0040568312
MSSETFSFNATEVAEILSKVTAPSDFLQIPTQELKNRDLEQFGHRERSNMCHRKPTYQHNAPGGISRTQKEKPRATTHSQGGIRKEEKIKVPEGCGGLPSKPRLPVARFSAFHQTTQLPQLFWLHRQQAWHFQHFYLPFFFREQPRSPKRKTRRGGQCRRGFQKPDVDPIPESLTPHWAPVSPLVVLTVHFRPQYHGPAPIITCYLLFL